MYVTVTAAATAHRGTLSVITSTSACMGIVCTLRYNKHTLHELGCMLLKQTTRSRGLTAVAVSKLQLPLSCVP